MSWIGVRSWKDNKDSTESTTDSDLNLQDIHDAFKDVHLEGDVEHQAVSIGEVGAPTRFRHIKNNKYVKRLYLVLAALAAIFVFSSLLRLAVKKNSNKNPTASGSDDIDLSGSSIRESHLIILVHEIAVDNAERESVADPASPQRQAIQWLANEDPMNMEIPETRFDVAYPAFLQRYSSAVLAFAFGADLLKPYGFLSGDQECAWNVETRRPDGSTLTQGLLCEPGQDKVIKVVLQTVGLNGAIPKELGNLHAVSHLHLDENNLAGKLPPTMRRLSALREFTATRNNLSGHLPAFLLNLQHLRHVELSKNRFSGPLSSALGNLGNQDETADGVTSPLRVLALDNNKFNGPLTSLNVLTVLEELYLNDNSLTGRIGGAFAELSQLAILDASNNKLTGKVPDYLLQLSSMAIINLHTNALNGQFPHGNATNLKYLDLHNNELDSVLPHSIGQHPNLAYLDLSKNKLEGILVDEFRKLSSLQYLFLANNPSLDPAPIPEWILQLPILKSLSLKNTARNGPLPDWLGELKQLHLLHLENNFLNGTIPSSLASAEALKFLFLNRNGLVGDVPATLSNLTELNLLNLDHNALTGAVPPAMCDLDMDVLVADCDTSGNQPEPQIECTCCTKCCLATADSCNTRDWDKRYSDTWGGYYERFNIVEDGDVFEIIGDGHD